MNFESSMCILVIMSDACNSEGSKECYDKAWCCCLYVYMYTHGTLIYILSFWEARDFQSCTFVFFYFTVKGTFFRQWSNSL